MPRETSRKANLRADATLNEDRSVQLQTTRRFFSNQGSDQATRQARALQNAFSAGTELAVGIDQRNIEQGRREAITGRGAGEARREEEKNIGYNAAWDQLDAEADLNLAKKELPELLRGANWEDLTEQEVQGIVTDYMQENFDGITADSAYGGIMAPGLLAAEQELLSQHRDIQIEKIQQDQRSTIVDNLQNRFNATDEFDYEYAAEQTNIFFDGADKRVVYWESVYDFAIRNGRPDIITQVPERFANGDPTGIDDPLMAAEHRAAISAATVQAAKQAKAQQDALDAANKSRIVELQFAVADARSNGMDPSPFIDELKGIDGVKFADVTSAKNFGDSQLDEGESRSANLSATVPLWDQVFQGQAGPTEIMEAYNAGDLGSGLQGEENFRALMNEAQSVRQSRDSQAGADVSPSRNVLNKTYNPQLGGPLTAIDPFMHRVNVDANSFFNAQIADGKSGFEALNATRERFDPIVGNAEDLNTAELTGRRTQGDFTSSTLQDADFQRVIDNPRDFTNVFGGVPPHILNGSLVEQVSSGKITQEQAEDILSNLY